MNPSDVCSDPHSPLVLGRPHSAVGADGAADVQRSLADVHHARGCGAALALSVAGGRREAAVPGAGAPILRRYNLRKAGDYEGAVREYSLALAADANHFKAHFNRAFSNDKLGRCARRRRA